MCIYVVALAFLSAVSRSGIRQMWVFCEVMYAESAVEKDEEV